MSTSFTPVLRGLLAALIFLAAPAFADDGEISSLSGGVFINNQTAQVGAKVNDGDIISTGPGAWVVLVMTDGSVLNLKPDTKAELINYVYDADNPGSNNMDVEVKTGSVRYVSGFIAENNPDDVKISAGGSTFGVEGTDFSVEYVGGDVVLNVWSGTVNVTLPNGQTVRASQGTRITYDASTGSYASTSAPSGGATDGQGGEETSVLRFTDTSDRADVVITTGAPTTTGSATANVSVTTTSTPTFNQAITNTDE